MMRHKLKRTVLAAAALAALSLSACGNSSGNETTSAAEETETASEASSDAAADNDAAQTELEELSKVEKPASLGSVKLGQYDGIEISAETPYQVTDQDVDNYISYYILPSYMESVDDAIQDGDTVNIDYVGKRDGVAFDGGTAEGTDLVIGSGNFIDGFEEGLIGLKKGDKTTLNLTFPEDYFNEELAGAAVTFDVTINDVQRTPELTDGLAAEIDPEVTSAEAYREKTRAMLQENQDYSDRQSLSYQAIDQVVQASEVTPTEEAIDWKVADLIVNYYEPMMTQSYGLGVVDMLAMQGQTIEEFKADLRDVAEESIKQILVMDEIAKEENLTADTAEMEAFAADNNTTLDALKESVDEEEIRTATLEQMAVDFVIDHAKITYTDEADTAESTAE